MERIGHWKGDRDYSKLRRSLSCVGYVACDNV
jgi:hypothetical protein